MEDHYQSIFLLEKLRLVAKQENGEELKPIGGISITDIEELKNEPISIEIAGLDQQLIRKVK